MKTVKIKDIEIGKGMPKICIPITGKNREEILLDIEEILRQKPDLAEWRVDCYEEGEKEEKVLEMLETITDRLGQIPLLFTFRTAREGGSKEISFESYVKLLHKAADTGRIDLADVEIFFGQEASHSWWDSFRKRESGWWFPITILRGRPPKKRCWRF